MFLFCYPSVMNKLNDNSMRNLLPNPPENFSELLFQDVGWKYFKEKDVNKVSISEEKTQVIKALKDFSHETFEAQEEKVLKFDGGEIAQKLPSTNKLREENNKVRIPKSKSDNPICVRVMFVNDFLLNGEIEFDEQDSALKEIQSSFRKEAAELFYKMIKAMKLRDEEFVISAVGVESDEQISYLEELNDEISFFKPELVISLGAVATQKLLQNRERLAKIHGQFFTSKTTNNQQFSYQLMPLFHPELLLINPNMKKTAWIDMQKAMSELGLE